MHIKIQKILGIGSLEYYKMIKLHPKYEKKKGETCRASASNVFSFFCIISYSF